MSFVDRDAVIELLLNKQRDLCPVGLNRRSKVFEGSEEEWGKWESLINEVMALPEMKNEHPCNDCCGDCEGCVLQIDG